MSCTDLAASIAAIGLATGPDAKDPPPIKGQPGDLRAITRHAFEQVEAIKKAHRRNDTLDAATYEAVMEECRDVAMATMSALARWLELS